MTLTTHLRAPVILALLAVLVTATMAAQVVTSFIVKALGDSKAVRVSPATACKLSSDGTHFTGCSSIL